MFKHFLKSNKGFSLAEVMVAAGMLGVVSLGVMQLTKNMSGSTKALEASSEAITVTNGIKTVLLGENACKNTLQGINISGDTTLGNVKNSNNAVVFDVGNIYGTRAVTITGFRLTGRSTTADVTGLARTGTIRLFVDFEKLNKQITGPKTVTKEIVLNVSTNNSHVIQNCYNSENAARGTSCADVGGTFDPVNLRCTLDPYPTINTLSTETHVAVSQDFLRRFLLDLDVRYINQGSETLSDSSNTTTIGNSSAGDRININGRLYSYGNLYSLQNIIVSSGKYVSMSSDKTLKKNIKPLKSVLSKMDKIRGVSFDWKHNNDKDVGVIAQEIQSVFPELVIRNEETGKLAVKYSQLTAISIQAIKELKKENSKLKKDLLEITHHICKNSKGLSFCKKEKKKAKKVKVNTKKIEIKKK